MFYARAAIESDPEMVQHLLPAARERYRDAQAAIVSGSATGCVYLGGYAVEMILKHATLRVHGLRPDTPLRGVFSPVRARLQVVLGDIEYENYHSLEFWALALREHWRIRAGRVPKVVYQAVQRATILHTAWMVDIRYREALIQPPDAKEFLSSVGWFLANEGELWRR